MSGENSAKSEIAKYVEQFERAQAQVTEWERGIEEHKRLIRELGERVAQKREEAAKAMLAVQGMATSFVDTHRLTANYRAPPKTVKRAHYDFGPTLRRSFYGNTSIRKDVVQWILRNASNPGDVLTTKALRAHLLSVGVNMGSSQAMAYAHVVYMKFLGWDNNGPGEVRRPQSWSLPLEKLSREEKDTLVA